MPFLPRCFPRPLFDLSRTAKLDCLGGRVARLGWNGDTTSINPADEPDEVKDGREELEVQARPHLGGMVAISATTNKMGPREEHPAHADPEDVDGIGVTNIEGEATLSLIHPVDGRVVLEQRLTEGSS